MKAHPARNASEEMQLETEMIEEAVQQAVLGALWEHKCAGHPIVEWRDGRVVWIPPEQIPVFILPTG